MALTQCFQMCTLAINLICITDKYSISYSPVREYILDIVVNTWQYYSSDIL